MTLRMHGILGGAPHKVLPVCGLLLFRSHLNSRSCGFFFISILIPFEYLAYNNFLLFFFCYKIKKCRPSKFSLKLAVNGRNPELISLKSHTTSSCIFPSSPQASQRGKQEKNISRSASEIQYGRAHYLTHGLIRPWCSCSVFYFGWCSLCVLVWMCFCSLSDIRWRWFVLS